MRKRDFNKIFKLVTLVIICAFGCSFWGIDFVPISKYEPVKMPPGQNEAYYVKNWCTDDFGRREFLLWDKSRCDCLTKDYAIEFDFANKWAESIGQSLYYAKLTKRQPGVVLILTKWSDIVYLKRLESLLETTGIKVFVIKTY